MASKLAWAIAKKTAWNMLPSFAGSEATERVEPAAASQTLRWFRAPDVVFRDPATGSTISVGSGYNAAYVQHDAYDMVVNCCPDELHVSHPVVRNVWLRDTNYATLNADTMEQLAAEVKQVVAEQKDKRVLVHCWVGASRSVAVAAYIVCRLYPISPSSSSSSCSTSSSSSSSSLSGSAGQEETGDRADADAEGTKHVDAHSSNGNTITQSNEGLTDVSALDAKTDVRTDAKTDATTDAKDVNGADLNNLNNLMNKNLLKEDDQGEDGKMGKGIGKGIGKGPVIEGKDVGKDLGKDLDEQEKSPEACASWEWYYGEFKRARPSISVSTRLKSQVLALLTTCGKCALPEVGQVLAVPCAPAHDAGTNNDSNLDGATTATATAATAATTATTATAATAATTTTTATDTTTTTATTTADADKGVPLYAKQQSKDAATNRPPPPPPPPHPSPLSPPSPPPSASLKSLVDTAFNYPSDDDFDSDSMFLSDSDFDSDEDDEDKQDGKDGKDGVSRASLQGVKGAQGAQGSLGAFGTLGAFGSLGALGLFGAGQKAPQSTTYASVAARTGSAASSGSSSSSRTGSVFRDVQTNHSAKPTSASSRAT